TARRRLAFGAAAGLLVIVTGYTAAYGFGVHNIHRQQLTRVAASRWFFENVPGDFGIWVEGQDGRRELVNIGRTWVGAPLSAAHLDPETPYELTFNVPGDGTLTGITFYHLGDPAEDVGEETLRVRLFLNDPALGRQLLYETELS